MTSLSQQLEILKQPEQCYRDRYSSEMDTTTEEGKVSD